MNVDEGADYLQGCRDCLEICSIMQERAVNENKTDQALGILTVKTGIEALMRTTKHELD